METFEMSEFRFADYIHKISVQALELKQEVRHIEEERIQVLNNIEELEQKIKDLDNQMEESVREVDGTVVYRLKEKLLFLSGVRITDDNSETAESCYVE